MVGIGRVGADRWVCGIIIKVLDKGMNHVGNK